MSRSTTRAKCEIVQTPILMRENLVKSGCAVGAVEDDVIMIPGKATSQTQYSKHRANGSMHERETPQRPRAVLFAEDNDDLRYVMERCLSVMGYHVIACADGESALAEFYARPAVDILVTDYDMPLRTGLELAREITAFCPALPVVVITGTILPTWDMQEVEGRGWTFLSKPCRMAALEGKLRQILEPENGANI